MENNREDLWVADRMAATLPEWEPDAVRAQAVLNAALAEPPARAWVSGWAITAAAAAVCIVAAAFPQTRAAAQDLWARFVINRVDVVRLDLSHLPLETHISINGAIQQTASMDEAARLAGFTPDLPAGAVSGEPKVTVFGPAVVAQTIHVHDVEAALARVNATDVRVAPEWDGVTLRAVVGPLVGFDYPGGVEVMQARPFSLLLPSGFPLENFAEVAFRSVGASARDAETMARKFAANPAWLIDVPPDEVVNLQELSLVSGPALLVEEYDGHGAIAKDTVIRSTSSRIYVVSSPNRDLSLRISEAMGRR